jgi:hypothetical protein
MVELESILADIEAYEFEQLIAGVWEKNGWNTVVTQAARDRGIDVIAKRSTPIKQKQVIQAKAYSNDNKIGSDELRKYATLFRQEDADSVVIVTTGKFTEPAKELANDLGVDCINRMELLSIIQESGAEDIDVINKLVKGGDIDEVDPDFPVLWKVLQGYNNDLQQSGNLLGTDPIQLEFGDWVITVVYGLHRIFPKEVNKEIDYSPLQKVIEWAEENGISHEYNDTNYPSLDYSLYRDDFDVGWESHKDFAEQANIVKFDPKMDYEIIRSILTEALDIHSSDKIKISRLPDE